MPLNTLLTPIPSLQILSLAFLAILFLQSGLDKIFNYKGNFDWLTEHFANSPLKSTVRILMPVITLLEFASGALCAVGVIMVIATGSPSIGLMGAQLSAISILSLFFGQRVAQDYPGAATLTTYFLIAMAAIYVLNVQP